VTFALRALDRIACLRSGAAVVKPARLTARRAVTVVIPCFNYGRYLGACVASVLEQQCVDVEVLIVDDSSTDGSDLTANEIALTDRRIRVIHHTTNQGHITTFNDGLREATGDYVVVLSADDLLTPGSLARSVALLEAHPSVGLVYGYALAFESDAALPSARTETSHWLLWKGDAWLAARFRAAHNCARSPEVMIRASVQRQIGGYRIEVPHTSDLDMWLRAAHVSDVGYVAGTDQAWYRVHDQNMHKRDFSGDTARGILVDAQERSRTYDLVARTVITARPDSAQLLEQARRTIAVEALTSALQSFYRGVARDSGTDEFVELALHSSPRARHLPYWTVLAVHRRLGAGWAHRDPLSLAHELVISLRGRIRRWRFARAGI
jgi:GT2 family glycosyltransferase